MGSQQLSVFQARYSNLTDIPFFIFSLLSLFIVHVIIKSLIIKIINCVYYVYQFLVLDFLEVTNGMGKRIEDYKHINSGRLNNPDVGLVNSTNDSDNSKKGTYLNTP